MPSNRIALVTGATAGIGWETVIQLDKAGFRTIPCGRRSDRLNALCRELENPCLPRVFDIRDRRAVAETVESLPSAFSHIDLLVNNAGNAHGLAPIHEGDLDDWDAMIDINLRGLLHVSRAILPGMVQRQKGHVINVGSVAGKETYANGNVYCATKAAVDALNKAMLIDLNDYGIRVTAIHPGLVETEFSMVRFKGDSERAAAVYEGFEPLRAADVAECIVFAATRPPHVKITELTLFPTAQCGATSVRRSS